MRGQLKTIIHNLKESFDGNPWYGVPIMTKLDEVSWQTVNDKTYRGKSIAVLVQHIINWRIFVVKKLKHDAVYNIIIDGENDWNEITIANQEEWNTLKNTLQNTQDELLRLLSNQTDQILKQQVPGKAYLFGAILTSIAQHDIYHLGQIAMLNTMKQS